MMIIKSEYIRDKLSYIESKVKNDNKQHLFNINTTAEDIFMQILNDVYDLNLSNANDDEKDNFPAIDLIDRKKEIVFQVTSETSAKKVREDTIEKFSELVKQDEYKKYADYKIKMFYIKNKPNFQKATLEEFAKKGVPKAHLLGIEDINKEVSANPDIAQKVFKTLCKIFHDKICDSEISPQLTTKSSTYDSSFVGREDEIKAIDEMLKKSNSMLLINGIGGIGKSSLANHYLYIREQEFDYYGFIDGLGSFVSEFRISLDLKSEKEQDLNQEVIHKLQKIKGKKLLVIDNVEDIESNKKLIEMILSLVKYEYKILFTSRRKIKKVNSYHLGTLLFTDAQKLFLSYYPTDEIEKVDKIIGYLGLHTLFIKLVAETVENEGYCLDDILAKFENGELSKIEFIDEESGDEVTFNHNLQELFSMQNLKDEYILLLKRLAVLPSVDIELNFLEEILGKERLKGRLNFLVGRGWLIENEGSYKLHQIIKEFVWTKPFIFEEVAIVINYFINLIEYSNNPMTAINIKNYLIYFSFIHKVVKQFKIENLEIAKLYMSLGNIYNTFGEYNISIVFIKLSQKLYESLLGKNHILTSTLNHNLGQLYYRIGEDDKALPLLLEDLERAKKEFDENDIDFASNYSNIAIIYLRQNKFALSIDLLQSALNISLFHLGENSLETAIHYNNLANAYRHIAKNEESLKLYKKSIEIIGNVEGDEHPHLIGGYNNIGELYLKLKKYKQSLYYLNKALNLNKKLFQNDKHPNIGFVYGNIGLVYDRIKKYKKAYDYTKIAIKIFENNFSETHLDLINAKRELERIEKKVNQKVSSKIPRKSPCPCGSGKKYKKCCGK